MEATTSATDFGTSLGVGFTDIDGGGDLDRLVACLDFGESSPQLTPLRERTSTRAELASLATKRNEGRPT